jgi:phosphate transport system permease protein
MAQSEGVRPLGLARQRDRGSVLRDVREGAIQHALRVSALVSVAVTLGIVVILATEAGRFFQHVTLREFLFGTRWAPLLEPRSFGVLPLLCGTLLVTGGAIVIALPLGVGSAIFLSEYADDRLRRWIKPLLEVLAGIPTVVYGYFALFTVTPLLRLMLPQTQVFNAASASIVVGIMILPLVASLCDDAFRAVPNAIRQGAYALGATRHEVSVKVVLPAALSGVVASFVLAISRAVGETMAVALAAGMAPKMTLNPLQSIQTMTSYIVQVSLGDTPAGTTEYQTIFAVGAVLFVITLGLNLVGIAVLRRFREEYD